MRYYLHENLSQHRNEVPPTMPSPDLSAPEWTIGPERPSGYNGFDLLNALVEGEGDVYPIIGGMGVGAAIGLLHLKQYQTADEPRWTAVRELASVMEGSITIASQGFDTRGRTVYYDGPLADLLPRPILADLVALTESLRSLEREPGIDAGKMGQLNRVCQQALEGPVSQLIDRLLDADARGFSVAFSGDALEDAVDRRARMMASRYARDAAVSALNARQASGEAARERQGETLDSIAQSERDAAKFWTQCAFGLIGLGLVVPAVVLAFDFDISAASGWVTIIVKLAFSLPIFGAAAYSARIAAQHREHARRMRLLAVQVDTLESFVEPMGESAQTETRALFARRLFTESAGLTAPAADTISVIPAELIPLLERVVEQSRDKAK